jgi:hypothetical protein
MQTNTSSEFVELSILMEDEANEHEPWMWYMAQIAMEVAQARSSKKRLRIEDYLIKFAKKKDPIELTEEQLAQRIQTSKNHWLAIAGMIGKTPPQKTKGVAAPIRTRAPIRKRKNA